MRDYKEVSRTISALTKGETDAITKMATISCELFHTMDGFDWVGFYRVVEPELLKVGPYQGGHGCLAIPFDKGVCGACARTEETQIVGDVNAIADHIACSSSTQSEIVLPVFDGRELIAVLDIDSDNLNDFDQHDADELSAIIKQNF